MLSRVLRRLVGRTRPQRSLRRPRLALEVLESRCTPTAIGPGPAPGPFVVNTVGDLPDVKPGDGLAQDAAGNTSLRAAIMEANALGGSNSIQFNLPAGSTIALGSALPNISSDITISGPGASALTVTRADGAAQFSIFAILGSADAMITNLSITGGDAGAQQGGGILNLGTLNLYFCNVYSNVAGASGGGISNAGTLTVWGCYLWGNQAGTWGGGISNIGPTGGTATLTVRDSDIFSNTAATSGGGVYNGPGGALSGYDSDIYGNASYSDGGGLYNYQGAVDFHGGSLESNSATFDGGGFYVNGGTVTFDQGTSVSSNSAWRGGGGFVNAGSVSLVDCLLQNNAATAAAPGIAYKDGASPTLTRTPDQPMELV